jgi:hypothetical protein
MTAAEVDAARHGDLLLMFGKMLENDRAGGKPLLNKPLLNKPLLNKPLLNKPLLNKPLLKQPCK